MHHGHTKNDGNPGMFRLQNIPWWMEYMSSTRQKYEWDWQDSEY